jgi:hypothetical protein
MPDTTMDRFFEEQARILQQRAQASLHYPALWRKMIAEWNQPGPGNRVWLTYSANYLFRTNNICWAMDPLTLNWRLRSSPRVDAARDLHNLSFVLLTHAHQDHLDLDLLSALKQYPVKWVVPEFMLTDVIAQAGLSSANIIVPTPLSFIDLHGISILPFKGLHWENTPDGNLKGVPSLGYLIECNGRRWLFPGDTRTYDAAQLPPFPNVDVVFAHLWLGRGSALEDSPPLLDGFCRFHLDTGARHVILTHLNELGRDANDYWSDAHVELVRTKFREMAAGTSVSHLVMGSSVLL